MRVMHIIFLIPGFDLNGPIKGGSTIYVANMAKVLTKHGHRIEIVSEGLSNKTGSWENCKIHIIDAVSHFSDTGKKLSTAQKVIKNCIRSYYYNKKVREINRCSTVDIVQSVNFYALSLFRMKTIPYIVRTSDYPPLWSNARNCEKFDFDNSIKIKELDHKLIFRAIKKADGNIAPSYLLENIIRKEIGISSKVVEGPVDIPNIESCIMNDEYVEKYGKYILTFGAISNRKSTALIIECLDKILDKYPDVNYLFIGKDSPMMHNGEYVTASKLLEKKVLKHRDRVFFLGAIYDRKRLMKIINNAEICVLPTRVDNLPNAVMEAMALGKIVISTSGPHPTSVEQLIIDGENGFLAEVDNENSILSRIDEAMNLSKDKKNEMSVYAKRRVEGLIPEKVYPVMIDYYQEIILQFKKRTGSQ